MLYIAESTFSTPLEGNTRAAHREWVGQEMRRGRLVISGVLRPIGEPVMGCVILSAGSHEEAEQAANGDPAVRDGIARVTRVTEYEPHVRSSDMVEALGEMVVLERG